MKVTQPCLILCDPMDYIQSMEFSRPEYWSGEPFPSPGDLPSPGIEPRSPALQTNSLPAEPQGKPFYCGKIHKLWKLPLQPLLSERFRGIKHSPTLGGHRPHPPQERFILQNRNSAFIKQRSPTPSNPDTGTLPFYFLYLSSIIITNNNNDYSTIG